MVRDYDVVVQSTDDLENDAVEIYIDGTFSDRTMRQRPSGDWREALDAATMPVLQFAGCRATLSLWRPVDANPSLVYASKQTPAKMKYLHDEDVTTYEWAVRPFRPLPRPAHSSLSRQAGGARRGRRR